MRVTLPMHRRSPTVVGSVPTSCEASATTEVVSVAAKPSWADDDPKFSREPGEVKTIVIAPPVDVTLSDLTAAMGPLNRASSGSLVEAPSYSVT
jgi:hypothetical protein